MKPLLTLGFVVLAVVVAAGFGVGPFAPKGPYELALDRITVSIEADPELAPRLHERYRAACSWPSVLATFLCREARGEVDFQLAQKGVPRLDRETQVQRNVFLAELLSTLDDVSCGALGRQEGGTRGFRAAVGRLPAESVDRLVDLTVAAVAAELRATPPEKLGEPEVAAAQVEFQRGLDKESRSRLIVMSLVPRTAAPMSDADACWVGKTVYGRVAAMPEPHRSVMAVHLAK